VVRVDTVDQEHHREVAALHIPLRADQLLPRRKGLDRIPLGYGGKAQMQERGGIGVVGRTPEIPAETRGVETYGHSREEGIPAAIGVFVGDEG